MTEQESHKGNTPSPGRGLSLWVWIAPVLVLIGSVIWVWLALTSQSNDGAGRIPGPKTPQAQAGNTAITQGTSTAQVGRTETAVAKDTSTPIALSDSKIVIGIDLPVSGGDAYDSVPTLNGMRLAVDQANAAGGVTLADGKTYQLEIYLLDDVPPGGTLHDPAQSDKNSHAFVADPNTIVVLGPFNSVNAKAMMPILNNAGLCQISPSNTNQVLTKAEYGEAEYLRPTGNVTYFRVSTSDDWQGPATAEWVFNKLGLRKAYILDDTEDFGKLTASGFENKFVEIGGAVLGHESIPKSDDARNKLFGQEETPVATEGVPDSTSIYTPFLRKVAASGADMLYYGGCSSNGGPIIRKEMRAIGLDIPLVGNDCIKDNEFLYVAGSDAEGTYSVVTYAYSEFMDTAEQFVEDYRAAYGEEPAAYSSFGYEAAGIAIDAIKRGGRKDRAAVCEALRNTTNYKGILGETGFDKNGDTTNRIVSFYEVKNNKWMFVDQLRVK